MRQRILISVAVALVLVVASIISYVWRVFQISQANRTTDRENPEDGEKQQESTR